MQEFYDNGALKQQWHIEDGMQEGVSKSYYTSGEVMTEEVYHHGRLNGIVHLYNKNGNLAILTPIKMVSG